MEGIDAQWFSITIDGATFTPVSCTINVVSIPLARLITACAATEELSFALSDVFGSAHAALSIEGERGSEYRFWEGNERDLPAVGPDRSDLEVKDSIEAARDRRMVIGAEDINEVSFMMPVDDRELTFRDLAHKMFHIERTGIII